MPITPPQIHLQPNTESPPPYTCMSVSTKGPFLAAGSKTGIISIWNHSTGELLTTFPSNIESLWTIAMSHTGYELAMGGDSPEGFIRDAKDSTLPTTVVKSHQPNICVMVWSADDRMIATGSHDGSICVWDARSGPAIVRLSATRPQQRAVHDVKFSPDATRLVAIYGKLGDDSAAVAGLWDTASGQLVRTLRGHEQTIRVLAVAFDGRIATGSMDGTCKIWSAEGHCHPKFDAYQLGVLRTVDSVAFSPDGKNIAIGWSHGLVEIRDALYAGYLRQSVKFGEHAVNSVAYSCTGRFVAVGCDLGTTAVWNTASKEMLVGIMDKEKDTVEKVVFAPDEQYLITRSRLGLVHVWDLRRVLGLNEEGSGRSQ